MNTDHLILLCGWAMFGFTHSLLASDHFASFCRRIMDRHFVLYRPIYSLIAVLSLMALLIWQFSIPGIFLGGFRSSKWLIGLPFGCCGLWIMGLCMRKYFFNHSGIAVLVNKLPETFLAMDGINRYVRHPLYLGTLLLLWSLFLYFPWLANLIACAMITIYTLIGIQLEEKKLLRQFGQTYARYRRTTPMLIPVNLCLKCIRQFKVLLHG